MATVAEHLQAISDRADVINVGTPFPPHSNGDIFDQNGQIDQAKIDKHDGPRLLLGNVVCRRVEFVRWDMDGKRSICYEDFGVLDLGGPGETVIERGAGGAKEPDNPADAFRQAAEFWLGNNAQDPTKGDPKIVKWWLGRTDETLEIAYVHTIYEDDVNGGYTEKMFIAVKDGATVTMRPQT